MLCRDENEAHAAASLIIKNMECNPVKLFSSMGLVSTRKIHTRGKHKKVEKLLGVRKKQILEMKQKNLRISSSCKNLKIEEDTIIKQARTLKQWLEFLGLAEIGFEVAKNMLSKINKFKPNNGILCII